MKKDYCPAYSTRIHDPDQYANAVTRGIEHPTVRATLDRPHDRSEIPDPVRVPIVDLLGVDGHEFCSGYRWAGDDLARALADRSAWVGGHRCAALAVPGAVPLGSFQDGMIEFRFCHNRSWDGYQVSEMYPMPVERHDGPAPWRLITPYWRERDDLPFVTLLRVVDTYLHPESHDGAFWELMALARQPEAPERIVHFKSELRTVLTGERTGLHPQALFTAAHYDDGSDEVYLCRLWRMLYPDEHTPMPDPA